MNRLSDLVNTEYLLKYGLMLKTVKSNRCYGHAIHALLVYIKLIMFFTYLDGQSVRL